MIARDAFPNLIPQVGTFSPVKVDLTVKPVDPPVKGRFVRFECASMYGDACALHYIGVVQRRNMQQATPDPQGMFDVGSLIDDIGQQMATATLLHYFPFLPFSIPFSLFLLIVSSVVNLCK